MKPSRFEIVLLAIFAAAIIYQNLVPPLIGLADSGDFERVLPQAGLAHISWRYDDKYFLYFNSRYRITNKQTLREPYITSTLLTVKVARWLSIKAGQDFIFDIRVLAALQALVFVCGIWLVLVAARSLAPVLRIVLAVLLVLIFTSAGYIAYFNSFYSEPTALSFLAVAVGCALILIARQSSSVLLLIGYFLSVGMVVTAKPQYAPLAPLMGAFGIYLTRAGSPGRRWLSVALAVLVCGIALWCYRQTPRDLRVAVEYIGIFTDMLPNSSTPREDLASMGLNPDFAEFSGTTPYRSDSALRLPAFRAEFLAKVSSYTRPLFYLKRPRRLFQLCERSAKDAFQVQVPRLGYYEAPTGKPPQSHPPQTWGAVRGLFRGSVLFIILFFVTGLPAAVLWIKAKSETLRDLSAIYLLFVLIAIVQFFVPVLAQGEPDLEKHLWMFNLSFDVCLIFITLGCAHLIGVSRRLRSLSTSVYRTLRISSSAST